MLLSDRKIRVELENFNLDEICCKHCKTFMIDKEALICLQAFSYYLRRKYKRKIRIFITSAYRCKTHNEVVGGKEISLHLEGRAFDICSSDLSLYELYNEAFKSGLWYKIILYREAGFIHLDIGRGLSFGTFAYIYKDGSYQLILEK